MPLILCQIELAERLWLLDFYSRLMPDFLALLGEAAEADEPGREESGAGAALPALVGQPVAIAPAAANTRGRRGKAQALFFSFE